MKVTIEGKYKNIKLAIAAFVICLVFGLLMAYTSKQHKAETKRLYHRIDSLEFENWRKDQKLSSYPQPSARITIGGENMKPNNKFPE